MRTCALECPDNSVDCGSLGYALSSLHEPGVCQLTPARESCERYEGCLVVLPFLGERSWSSVLGREVHCMG